MTKCAEVGPQDVGTQILKVEFKLCLTRRLAELVEKMRNKSWLRKRRM